MNRLAMGVALTLLLTGTLLTLGCARHNPGSMASGVSPTAMTQDGAGLGDATAVTSSPGTESPLGQESGSMSVSGMDPTTGAGMSRRGAADTMGRSAHAPEHYRRANGLRDLHFDFDQYEVRSDQQLRTLEENARWMRANPRAVLLVEGHADERGTNEYNLTLAERRAMSARNYLVAHGVSADRITTISYGEERPVCREHSENCWARNRWAQFLIKD